MVLTPELRHKHGWQNWDWEKIKFIDLDRQPLKYCDATMSSWQTLAWWTPTIINIDTYVSNDKLMSNTPGRINITKNWRYLVICNLWCWNATLVTTWVAITRNWNIEAYQFVSISAWTTRAMHSVSKIINCKAWDYLQMTWYWFVIEYTSDKTNMQVQELLI